jgi:AmiR/NasT family two-component response regulator
MKGKKVLILEDEQIFARELELELKDAGYDVTDLACSATDALSSVERVKPDLAILDVNINDTLTGLDVGMQLRSRYGIPIILLTAYSDKDTLEKAKSIEPYGYVLKPFRMSQLRCSMEVALAKVKMEKEHERLKLKYAKLEGAREALRSVKNLLDQLNDYLMTAAGHMYYVNRTSVIDDLTKARLHDALGLCEEANSVAKRLNEIWKSNNGKGLRN